MTELYAQNGVTSEFVETSQNAAGIKTPILTVSPDRSLWLRFLNHVAKGSTVGLPCYFKLRDSNGDPLPPNTKVAFYVKLAGHSDAYKVSEKIKNISFWNQNDITTQQDVDNIDGSKIKLQHPEMAEATGNADHVDIRDVDDFLVEIESDAVIDWSQSRFEFDSNGVEGPHDL
ncbi:hypothetical protein [Halocalculus aciditolerans]|uniref:Uncharacterized protein n=1 Tax=Halocalculus aciditolerans TaxID=1383812 RepID=A0A830FLF4_9EURY|nr:hypothetical protein [Halocalculus aciditolerans]GGL57923.1 hypothetical protein GCM10009039_15130 [Halocalculus aciditolerans]